MNIAVDLAGVALILVNAALGFRYGLLRRGVAFAGLYFGIFVASFTGNAVARALYGTGRPESLYADAWTFLGVAAVVTLAVEILGALYYERIKSVASLMFDRTAGAVAGLVVGFLEIALVCLVGLSTGTAANPTDGSAFLPNSRTTVSDGVKSSMIGGRVNALSSPLDRLFQPVLPNDLSNHLIESAKADALPKK